MKKLIILLSLITALTGAGYAQKDDGEAAGADEGNGKDKTSTAAPWDSIGYPNFAKYVLDLKTLDITPESGIWISPNKRNLPFDVPFILSVKNSKGINNLHLKIGEVNANKLWSEDSAQVFKNLKSPFISRWNRTGIFTGITDFDSSDVTVVIPPLEANKLYFLKFAKDEPVTGEQKDKAVEAVAHAVMSAIQNNLGSFFTAASASKQTNAMAEYRDRIRDALFAKLSPQEIQKVVSATIGPVEVSDKHDLQMNSANMQQNTGLPTTAEDMMNQMVTFDTCRVKLSAIARQLNISETEKQKLLLVNGAIRIMSFNFFSAPSFGDLRKNYSPNFPDSLPVSDSLKKVIKSLYSNLAGAVVNLTADNDVLNLQMDGLKMQIANTIERDFVVMVNTLANFRTRAEWYISPRGGFLISFLHQGYGSNRKFDKVGVTPYYGITFNFFPINREAHYHFGKIAKAKDFFKLISMDLGVTALPAKQFYDKNKTGILGDFGFAAGLGLTIYDFIKLNGGVLLVTDKGSYPAVNKTSLYANGYLGITIDLDLQNYIEHIVERVRVSKFKIN